MLSGQKLGLLNQIVSDVRTIDPENEIKEIHVGSVNHLFFEECHQSEIKEIPIYMTDVDGIPIYVNAKFGEKIIAVKRGEKWEDKFLDQEVVIDGFKPTKSWLRRNRGVK